MTKEVETIALTRINNGAHYNFMEAVAGKAKANAKVYAKAQTQTDALTAAVKAENDVLVLSRKSALSDVIEKADKQRDGYFSGYREGVRSYVRFPSGSQKTAADKLWQHLMDYGITPKMQLDRETGLMTNLVEDLQGKYAAEVANLNLQPFVEGMKLANDNVRMALAVRDTEQSAEVLGALKEMRARTDEAYQSLIRRINAYAEIEGAADYAAFIDDVNQLIRRFKQEVLKTTSRLSPKEKEKKTAKLLAGLIPAFEKELGLEEKSLSYAGHTAKLDAKTTLYLLYINDDATNFIWVKIAGEKLVRVNYMAGPGKPGGVGQATTE